MVSCRTWTTCVLALASASAFAAETWTPARTPRGFLENKGQWDARARFALDLGGSTAFVNDSGFTLAVAQVDGESAARSVAIRFAVEGATAHPAIGLDPLPGLRHFLRGADPSRYASGCRSFARVRLSGVAAGVDLELRAVDGGLEYDLVGAPGADLSAVRFRCEGARELALEGDSVLRVATALGDWRQHVPHAFAVDRAGRRTQLAVAPRLLERAPGSDAPGFALDVESAPPECAVVIDPLLAFSTLIGGSSDEPAYGGASFNNKGNVFVVGRTLSIDFPLTIGAFDVTANGNYDVFVTKLAPDGGTVVWSTLLGGWEHDDAFGIDLDPDGRCIVAGRTSSFDFPATPAAYDDTFNGYYDCFVSELGVDGTHLAFSTFLGGVQADFAYRLRRASDGTLWVAGYTESEQFPTTPGAYDRHFNGKIDGYVSQLSADGRKLLRSTYLGGEAEDLLYGLALDGAGGVHVGGYSSSARFPTTAHAFATKNAGAYDGWVAELSPDLAKLRHSTYVGGSLFDFGFGLAVLSDGSVAFCGSTNAPNFPTTAGALSPAPKGSFDGFVTRLAPDLTAVMFSTYVGGWSEDAFADLVLDSLDRIYLAGQSRSPNYPIAGPAYSAAHSGKYDALISVLDPGGAALTHSTFLGGSDDDFASALAIEAVGRLFVAGETRSPTFPVSPNAFDKTPNGGADAFILRYVIPMCVNASAAAPVGQGKGGAFGVPKLEAIGVTDPPYDMRITGGRPFAPAILLFGKQGAALPFDGGTLWLVPTSSLFVGQLDFKGRLEFEGPLPSDPFQCGSLVFEQVLIEDASAPGQLGVTLSNGLALTLGG